MKRSGSTAIMGLSLLYVAQGIPFGFAVEYLPVVLREAHFSTTRIAALAWLQLPWHLKVLWAGAADRPFARARSRTILLALQAGLAASVAAYAVSPLASAPILWFAITAVAALFAATQDVFVDALAVRALSLEQRGFGNVAQVAGYRVGILAGGAGLLLLVGSLGERTTVLLCAAAIAIASIGAFAAKPGGDVDAAALTPASEAPLPFRRVVASLVARGSWPVLALALTFKLGLHMASGVLKPMLVDAGWTKGQIGGAAVTLGTALGLVGAAAGGALHRRLGEPRALALSVVVQTAVCLPLVVAARTGSPHALTTFAIGLEHFASGLGTTVLFAALMTATRASNAGLHYTILTSANAVAIGLGGLAGGVLADRAGYAAVFVVAAAVTLAPIALVPRWSRAAAASAGSC